mmetsp:Transcript_18277/g.51595  ORF Transcript_18277/g.51595 Transcript_18277/m.51595 type:complete len:168 (+) Transcript_18277:92-595(+)
MGYEKTTLEEGEAGVVPKKGDTLTVHYTGTLDSGAEFDCSRKRGTPLEFKVGAGMVIKAWDLGLMDFTLGERATLRASPDFAYGKAGHPPVIPGNSWLNFDVQLGGINGRIAPGPDGRRRCGGCFSVEDTKGTYQACANCRAVFYCSRSCQRNAWAGHKVFCKKLRE